MRVQFKTQSNGPWQTYSLPSTGLVAATLAKAVQLNRSSDVRVSAGAAPAGALVGVSQGAPAVDVVV